METKIQKNRIKGKSTDRGGVLRARRKMAKNITNDKLLDPWQMGSSSTAPALQAIKVAVLISINLTALTGNAMVCLCVYKKPSLRSKTGYLILSLAVTDLTGALFVTPLTTGSLLLARNGTARWIMNDVDGPLCFFQGLLTYGLTSVSLTIMALAAITRYLCVVRPHIYRKYVSSKLIGISVMLIWIVSLGLQAAIVVPGYATFTFLPTFSACMMSFGEGRFIPLGKIIEKVFLVLWIGIPLSVIVMCYTAIYHTVRRHNSRIANTLEEPKPSLVNLEVRKDREHSSHNAAKLQTSMPSGIQNDLRHEGNEMKEEEEMENSHFRPGRRNGIEIASAHQEIQKSPKVHKYRRRVHQNDCSDNDFECQGLEQMRQKGREIITVIQECDTQRREHTRPNHRKGREISPECHLDKNIAARLKQNRTEAKVTRTVLAVFLGFLVCWFPILMAAAIRQSLPNSTPHWDLALIYFGALSTAINPFIYAATIREFRRTYISLLKCNKM